MFNFYCRKYVAQRGDFEKLNANLVVLGLHGYNRFCKDFKVPVSSADVTTVWKKSSKDH